MDGDEREVYFDNTVQGMRRHLTRGWVIVAGGVVVVAVVVVFALVGVLSKSTKSTETTTTAAAATTPAPTHGTAPTAQWYWTMAVSPTDEKTLLLATSGGLYRSTDGGKSWRPTGPKGLNATSVVQNGKGLLAGGVHVGTVASPVVMKGKTRSAGAGPQVLVSSSDDGKTWRPLHPAGLPDVTLQALALDPAGTTLYALLNDGRLYRSTDGARSFRLAARKIGAPPWALVVTKGGHFVAGNMDTGAYASADGTSWRHTPFTDSRGGTMVMEYAVNPGDPATVLMSAFGLELSRDAGKRWHRALKSDVMFGPVAWAPGAKDVAYAVGFDGTVWRSGDGAKTWTKVT
jgi:photosystem II stability/assembly factor-like uncharacterized protein